MFLYRYTYYICCSFDVSCPFLLVPNGVFSNGMVGGALHAATKPWRTPTAFPSKNENSRLEKGELRSRSPSPPFPQVLAPKNQQNFWKIFDGLGMPTYIYIHINLYLPLLLWAGGRQSNLWAWKWFCPFLPVVTIDFDRMRLSRWPLKGQEKGRSETCFHDIWNQRNGL